MKLDMAGIITSRFDEMMSFYKDIVGLKVKLQMENYVEFESEGVRFAISTADVMKMATGDESFADEPKGHSFELAFIVDSPEEVDEKFDEIVEKGAKLIKKPEDMPWGQRAGFFADPDGNIHEVFANLNQHP